MSTGNRETAAEPSAVPDPRDWLFPGDVAPVDRPSYHIDDGLEGFSVGDAVFCFQGEGVFEERQNRRGVHWLATVGCTTCICCILMTESHTALCHLDGADWQITSLVPNLINRLRESAKKPNPAITCHLVGGLITDRGDAAELYSRLLAILFRQQPPIKLQTAAVGVHNSLPSSARSRTAPVKGGAHNGAADSGGAGCQCLAMVAAEDSATEFQPAVVDVAVELATGRIGAINVGWEEIRSIDEFQQRHSCSWGAKSAVDSGRGIAYDCGEHRTAAVDLTELNDNVAYFMSTLAKYPDLILPNYSTSPHCEPDYFVQQTIEMFNYILSNRGKILPEKRRLQALLDDTTN